MRKAFFRSGEQGNMLFLILIAVALFAALSYAVTSSLRTNETGSSEGEKRELNTAEINGFLSSVQAGVTRITTAFGTQIHDISFNNNAYKTHGGSALPDVIGTPANPAIHLFLSEGGGVVPRTFELFGTACGTCGPGMALPGHVTFHWMSIPNIGSTASDAVMLINFLSDDACLAFNRKNGINVIPTLSFGEIWLPTSGQDSPVTPANGGPDLSIAEGQSMLCYEQDGSPGENMLYLVIKEF